MKHSFEVEGLTYGSTPKKIHEMKNYRRGQEDWSGIVYSTLFRVYLVGLYILFAIFKSFLYFWNSFRLWKIQLQSRPENEKRHLVIIGGGYAGVFAAFYLEHEFKVTLIDTKDFFEFTPSKLRTLVEPSHTSSVKMLHSEILSQTRIIVDNVKEVRILLISSKISEEFVICKTQSIEYDYMLICTGSRYTEPVFPPIGDPLLKTTSSPTVFVSSRSSDLETYHSQVVKSQKILIIGGGTVGVELGAEIIERFPNKEVILVHSNEKLMDRSPLRATRYVREHFHRKGVRVLLNEKVIAHQGNFFMTTKGSIIEADLAFMCTGNIPNSEFIRSSCFADRLNTWGFVKVNPYLQLQGYMNIFVAGDITDIPGEEKLCQTAAAEVSVVIKNLRNMEKRVSLHNYTPSKFPMVISLGKFDGVFTYRGWTLTGFVPAAMKEFIEWKEMVFYWNWKQFAPRVSQGFEGCRVSNV